MRGICWGEDERRANACIVAYTDNGRKTACGERVRPERYDVITDTICSALTTVCIGDPLEASGGQGDEG
jgi:hypothetical protein